ncbi:MAG: 16S rRNA (cytosine(1402)-N(4))-methyltransferase RsmH [Planctomycetaceae bacterium]|nr:MAG: 16S rRNA (cytosine(1402)-N(4))-methyltransferase RsmH [Planctomycetaceae bacterium]
MAAGHLPVLPREVCLMLNPAGKAVILDCTVGLGGHAEALLEHAGPDATLIGLDVDESNLHIAKERLSKFTARVRLFQANFAQAGEVLQEAGVPAVDVLLADLGISSRQLDDPARGLSFMADGPLDMRLDLRMTRTAADLVNQTDETELANLIFEYGEERYSRRIARAIGLTRKTQRIERTSQLADIIVRAMPAPVRHARRGAHPATRTFQALRIAVNEELAVLEQLLAAIPNLLAVNGRAAIISFHSLEDRLVKRSFAGWVESGSARLLCKKPLVADEQEVANNPRSRSAKLRGIEKQCEVRSA